MQAADRGMRIPGAARPMLLEHRRHRVGVVGEMLQRHRAILDEGDRLPVAFHRHHDVEAGFAHLPDRLLPGRLDHLHHRIGEAVIGHALVEPLQVPLEIGEIVSGELDQEQAVRPPPGDIGERAHEKRDIGAEHQHIVVDEFDRDRAEPDDMPGRLHRRTEIREMADAHDAVLRQRRELERRFGGDRERAFRADEQMRQVRPRRDQFVEIIAADAALHLREDRLDRRAMLPGQRHHPRHQVAGPRRSVVADGALAEREGLAVMEHRLERDDVVDHLAVVQRARARGIVAGHAADRAAARRRGLDWEEQPVLPEPRVQRLQHEAGRDRDGARLRIVIADRVEMPTHVEHQPVADRLAVLRCAAAACDHRHAMLGRDRQRRRDIGLALRKSHALRQNLVDRGVGGVAATGKGIEADLAFERLGEPALEAEIAAVRTGKCRLVHSAASAVLG